LAPPLADPIRFSDPICQLCEKLSFVLIIHNRETSKKNISAKFLPLNKANKVEKSWTNFKYSVNNEENKDNDQSINRNNVQSEQLVTQSQNNNGVTLNS